MSQAQTQALETYLRLTHLNAAAHAFKAAADVGVFEALAGGQKTAEDLAEACDAKAEPLALVLDALCSLGVLERYEDDYALAPVMHLLPPHQYDLDDAHWRGLPRLLKTGEPPGGAIEEEETAEARPASVEAAATQWIMTPAALQAAAVLDIGGSRKDLKILDLGAGSGVWSLTLAYRDPQSHVTAVDAPEALPAVRDTAKSIGLTDRLTALPLESGALDLPAGEFDLAILANVLHRNTAERNRELLAQVYAALKPGGEAAIIDVFSGQKKGDLHRAIHGLSLALAPHQGRHYGPHEIRDWLGEAGFADPQYAHLPAPPHTLGLLLAGKE